jgi:hypothetical protein
MAETDVDDLPRIYLFRSNVQVTSKDSNNIPALGERGFLVVGNDTFYAIERIKIGQFNCVRMPKGVYMCTMTETKKVGKGFWIEGWGQYGHNVPMPGHPDQKAAFMIHAANYPHEVEGCVAPGRTYLDNGVGESNKAMQAIFTFCGGWGEGRKMMFDVDYL